MNAIWKTVMEQKCVQAWKFLAIAGDKILKLSQAIYGKRVSMAWQGSQEI